MAARVMLVTGGGRGIGAATALEAARRGYAVCVNYRSNRGAAEGVVAAVHGIGGRAIAVAADVSVEADVARLFAELDASKLGPLHVLVNNAGIVAHPARVDRMDRDRLERMFDVNVLGSFYCAREAIRRMSTHQGGAGGVIVNVSSAAARIGSPGEYVDYAATKGAIDTMTLGLAKELADDGIRVVAVRPGIIETEIHASGGQPDRPERLKGMIPMKRAGRAEEVAAAILWLASDEASYSTGAILDVAGGR
jgi:NAD(P)-dependent dehydrogenase (short-subunit alcohol dehydrogenase family)